MFSMQNERDSLHERLPSLDDAQEMDFAALSKLLRQVIDRGFWSGVSQESQFSTLLEHLRSRLPQTSPNPTIEAIKPPAFDAVWRQMAQSVDSGLAERLASVEKTRVNQLDTAISGIDKINSRPALARKVRVIEQAIKSIRKTLASKPQRGLNASEKNIYSQWLVLFLKALEDYANQRIRFFRTPANMLLQAHEIETRTNESSIVRTRRKVVDSLSRDFDRRHHLLSEVMRVPWTMLPMGEGGIAQLTHYVREFQRRHPERRMHPERFDFAWSLEPTKVYMGNDEFEGYLALVFSHSGKVLLEHPEEGNAAYVFNENWRELSRLSKSVLLQRYCGSFERVLHRETGDWRAVIKQLVGR